MKLLSLNIWGGRAYDAATTYIKQQSETVDIFCFQEVYHTNTGQRGPKDFRANLFDELTTLLPDFVGHYAPAVRGYDHDGAVDYHLDFGLATFIRRSLAIQSIGDVFVYRHIDMPREIIDGSTQARNVQIATLDLNGQPLNVFNFHGMWYYSSKEDNELRLEHFRKLKQTMDQYRGPKILCGDFNVVPKTQSLAIFEAEMRNLIQEFDIQDTRGSLYPKEIRYADYILVTPDLTVNDFQVPNIAISDHLPMILDFSLPTQHAKDS